MTNITSLIKRFNKEVKLYVRDRDRLDLLSVLIISHTAQSPITTLDDCINATADFVSSIDAGNTDWGNYLSRLSSINLPDSVFNKVASIASSIAEAHPEQPSDIMAVAYREFLKDSGKYDNRNIILTPPHVADFMAEMLEVEDNDAILDPCSGTGMLLLACARNSNTTRFIAVEKDPSLFLALVSNLIINKLLDRTLHLLCGDTLAIGDSFTANKAILNPPYADKLSIDFISKSLSLCNGNVVAIVPSTTPKNLPDAKQLCSVVTMPSAIFNDSAVTVNTSVTAFNRNNTSPTAYEAIPDDGYVSIQRKGRIDKRGIWESEKKRVIGSLAKGGVTNTSNTEGDYVKLGDVFHMENGKIPSSLSVPNGAFPFITASKDWSRYSSFSHDCEGITMALRSSGSLGRTHYVNGKVAVSNLCVLLTVKPDYAGRVLLKFYNEYFAHIRSDIAAMGKGATKKTISLEDLSSFLIKLFPVEQQERVTHDVIEKRDEALAVVGECDDKLAREMGS